MHAFGAGANPAQNQQAQNEIFGEVCTFANEKVKQLESLRGCMGKKKAQDGHNETAGVIRGEGASGKTGYYNGP